MSDERSGKPFFDTTVLLYLMISDPRQAIAKRICADGGSISVQVLNEFVSVSRNKLRLDWDGIEGRLRCIHFIFETVLPLTEETHRRAVALAGHHGYDIYDANILAAALLAGCTTLYTEDMQDGQRIEGLTIRNPFSGAGPEPAA